MAENKEFYAGFAAAVAALVRTHDQPTIAASILASYAVDLDHFEGVDEYDMREIRPLYETEYDLAVQHPIAKEREKKNRRQIYRRMARS